MWAVAAAFAAPSPAWAQVGTPAAPTPTAATAAPAASPEAFVRWATPRIAPVQTLDLAGDMRDLHPVGAMIGAARVVAVGEPAHGSPEPLAFRNRLVRYLVEARGFTAVAVEGGLPESRVLYDYVLGAAGTPDAAGARRAARAGFTYGFGALAENVALLAWARAYNADPRHARKVRVYGMDLSFADGPADTARAHLALDRALAYLARVDTAAAREARARLAPSVARFTGAGYSALTSVERDALSAALDALAAQLERGRPGYVSRSSVEDFAWALREVAIARWTERMFRVTPAGTPTTGVTPGMWRATQVRDAAMAENVRWVLAQEGPAGRILVFAHNGHVKNARTVGGIWDAFEAPPESMGAYLKATLGDAAVLIATSGGAHGAGLPAAPALPDSLNVDAALAAVGRRAQARQYVLDLRSARTAPAAGWVRGERLLRANYRTAQRLVPATAYDALFVVDSLTAPRFAPSP